MSARERRQMGVARAVEQLLAEELRPPSQVRSFGKLEELGKMYALELPYAARAHLELAFQALDGRKLAALEPADGGQECAKQQQVRSRGWRSLLRKRPTACCLLSASDTANQLCLTPSSSADSGLAQGEPPELGVAAELGTEVLGPLWSSLRRSSSGCAPANRLQVSALAASSDQPGPAPSASLLEQQQQQLLQEAGADAAGRVSVCLLDKRRRWLPAPEAAAHARRWARLEAALVELRWKLRQAGRPPRARDARRLARLVRARRLRAEPGPPLFGSAPAGRKLSKRQLSQLIELTKLSLNQLIDAQLLLRNKLAAEQQQQQQSGAAHHHFVLLPPAGSASSQPGSSRDTECSLLLRNNFNLLKIWQNLEETTKIACFVTEPIKATLADLFHFSRQRPQLHQLRAACSPTTSCMLASPLVCLDSIQVKRGMLQILEALNYLHSICKLIHRNPSPRNILVVSNDNWKLSGLQFAIRFESATISDSASIMAHEVASPTPLLLLQRHSTPAGGSQAALRRQRTLHQTRCSEFVRNTKRLHQPTKGNLLLQPELDYLAPEIWHQAKCSHKSDLFSYALVLLQTYDLGRHRPPLNCQRSSDAYELQLKKLHQSRKRKLARSVPFEMRATLLDMLDSEPNLRPSANYALQLFRRPLELCQVNEDSLRHLKSSLGYMDSRWQVANTSSNNNNNLGSICPDADQLQPTAPDCGSRKRSSYFKRVTHLAERSPQRGQTRNLQLFNILLRSLDSLTAAGQQQQAASSRPQELLGPNTNHLHRQLPTTGFHLLRCHFEQTLESLRQLYRLTRSSGLPVMEGDARLVLFLVAFHRRLLEQLALMRDEVPPICRLTAAANKTPTQNHLILAELEDKFQSLVSRESLPKLAPVLTDPTLKLEQFLLVYELTLDLLAFVGQRCRQSFSLRSRQLLSELTPITGCPALSSSDEDDDDDDDDDSQQQSGLSSTNKHYLDGQTLQLKMNLRNQQQQQQQPSQQQLATSLNRDRLSSLNSQTISQHLSGASQHRLSNGNVASQRQHSASVQLHHDELARQLQQQKLSRNKQQQQHLQQPTKISITAPSPMGSVREVNRLAQDSHPTEQQPFSAYSRRASQLAADSDHNQIIRRTSELSLRDSERRLANQQETSHQQQQQELEEQRQRLYQFEHRSSAGSLSGELETNQDGDKSRSQLIDDLLRTINDDSFNDIVDYNNKFASQQRPKSAIDGCQASRQLDQQQPRPSSLSSSSGGTRSTQGQQQQQQQARPRTLALGQVPGAPSKFDNVIRRMSTNLVQNFTKLGGQQSDVHQHQPTGLEALRREKSSNPSSSTYAAANSLYVDNQVPARRHSDNTINIPSIQVALSSPCAASGSRTNLNQRASQSASKLATKWKLSAKSNSDKLSPNFGSALGYMRRHSSGNTTNTSDQGQSNGPTSSLLFNASPFKTRSSSNLGLDFLLSNRSMKRRCSAASMLGHQTQRKAEDLIDAGMKSVQNMFS